MKTIRQINNKNRQGHFFSNMTNIRDFDPNLLDIDMITFKSNDLIIYHVKYINNLESSNSLYLDFNNLDAYIGENGEDKYLVIAITHNNGSFLGKDTEIWNKIREQIRLVIGDEMIEYSKDFMKIKFELDDDLPLDEILDIPVCILITRGVFKEDRKFYPQVLLHECYYEYEREHEESTNL